MYVKRTKLAGSRQSKNKNRGLLRCTNTLEKYFHWHPKEKLHFAESELKLNKFYCLCKMNVLQVLALAERYPGEFEILMYNATLYLWDEVLQKCVSTENC